MTRNQLYGWVLAIVFTAFVVSILSTFAIQPTATPTPTTTTTTTYIPTDIHPFHG